MQRNWIGVVELVTAMMISGTIGFFVVVSNQPTFNVVFSRCLIGAVGLGIVCAALGMFKREYFTKRNITLAVLSGVAVVTNWILLFGSFSKASITISTVVYHTQPIILAMMGVAFLGEKLNISKVFWLLFAFVGMIAVVSARDISTDTGTDYLMGVIMAFGAAVLYAVTVLLVKKLTGVPPHLVALTHVSVGTIMLFPLMQWQIMPNGQVEWGAILALGLMCTVLMYIIMYDGIQRLETSVTGALAFIYPIAAIVVDYVAFDRQLTWMQWVGSAAILLGAAAMTLRWRVPFIDQANRDKVAAKTS
ncbi:threonine/homoserine efflux transporter RhtA [Maritalea mobilis]|uniref:Threonine/homoserine efflux transporter RhtA n=1 Tax=Maritalea mobilis TaxID=483324 RepID=A0A4R6VNV1_9HYPH|nr:DMT family transporter [Maritalea mobilis]TDQ63883.1 threonine/homoserine efflux transporter RhtA [Maritalea mobilis]